MSTVSRLLPPPRKPLAWAKFQEALVQVVQSRWKGLVGVEPMGTNGWHVRGVDTVGFHFWRRGTTYTTKACGHFFGRWAQERILNDVAGILGCRITDDTGCGPYEPWGLDRLGTYTEWALDAYGERFELMPQLKTLVPEEFQQFL